MNSVHAIYCGMRAFLFLGGEETRGRKAEGRNATPLGVPADLQSADKKGSTAFSRICNPQP